MPKRKHNSKKNSANKKHCKKSKKQRNANKRTKSKHKASTAGNVLNEHYISCGALIDCIVSDELQQNDDYIGRIDKLLKKYQKFLDNNNNNEETFNNIYELIFDEYGSDNVNQFMNDYAKYCENIDKNHIVEKYHEKCEFDIQNCPFVK